MLENNFLNDVVENSDIENSKIGIEKNLKEFFRNNISNSSDLFKHYINDKNFQKNLVQEIYEIILYKNKQIKINKVFNED